MFTPFPRGADMAGFLLERPREDKDPRRLFLEYSSNRSMGERSRPVRIPKHQANPCTCLQSDR